jgi:hypothetical protein
MVAAIYLKRNRVSGFGKKNIKFKRLNIKKSQTKKNI